MVKAWPLALAACGAHVAQPVQPHSAIDITLYRNAAVVRQRVDLAVPAGPSRAKVMVAAGVATDRVTVVDRGGLDVTGVRGVDQPPDDGEDPPVADRPIEVQVEVVAPRAGRYALELAYTTERIAWDAAYTMTTTPARDRATLRGALAIRNTTGVAFRGADVRVVDAEVIAWRERAAEHLASSLVGTAQSSTPVPPARDLGALDVGAGETRGELIAHPVARPMRSVLIYDPVGTKLDNQAAAPLHDEALGAHITTTTVTESFEVARDERETAGLPAGPVRLLERRDDGGFTVLGESRLFDAANRGAKVETIAIGTAEDVTGHRERRDLSIDDDNQRVVEEFAIELDNKRAHAADVLVREHLYRGQNWTLAYSSDGFGDAAPAKDGDQALSLRTRVPAHARRKILYTVVYTVPR